MAIQFDYERDDVRRRTRITARQPLRAADLIAIVDRQLSRPRGPFAHRLHPAILPKN
jgi:hypothetical protein